MAKAPWWTQGIWFERMGGQLIALPLELSVVHPREVFFEKSTPTSSGRVK